ncbi:hypothetical protein E5D57_010362 [Metarhizium anisopliae]|nr:hypothetical protein E5D57_010362 [Metarhizium anisopliae]
MPIVPSQDTLILFDLNLVNTLFSQKKAFPPNTAATSPSAKTALLLLDYDNIIVDMIHPVEEKDKAVKTANALLKTARESSATVVHCVIDMNAQPAETSKTRQRWEFTYKPLPVLTPERLELIAELAPGTKGSSAKEFVVAKLQGCVSAMKSRRFVSSLREKYGVESVVICGLISVSDSDR